MQNMPCSSSTLHIFSIIWTTCLNEEWWKNWKYIQQEKIDSDQSKCWLAVVLHTCRLPRVEGNRRVRSSQTHLLHCEFEVLWYPVSKRWNRDWKDGSMVQSICCSCGIPGFRCKHPRCGSQQFGALVPKNPLLASKDTRQVCGVCTDRQTDKAFLHIK